MSRYEVVPATLEHARELAVTMRHEDVLETWAATHMGNYEVLENSVKVSRDAWTGLVDGRVLAMFGVVTTTALSRDGCPWLLGSQEVGAHGRAFARFSKEYIRLIAPRYDTLANFVDANYPEAIRWVRWMGFKIEPAAPFGPEGAPFHLFWMKNP